MGQGDGGEPIVDTAAGKVRGAAERSCCEAEEYYAFRGIPYAEPPVGQLRFQDPVPKKPWSKVIDAKNFGPICAQTEFILQTIKGSDDCLYINVYTKNLEPKKKLPVMVWIHGGGFVTGEGNDDLYGPDYFMRKDVVLVTFNYRLGVLGFLNLEDDIAPGNYGLKDQVLALKWVQENIDNFGGDSDNVTIFGESAGGASVHYLTLSPLAKGLFHKAIMQSGVALNPWAFLENPKRFAYKLCELLGNNTKDHKEIVEFLQTIDCLKLAEVQNQVLSNEEKNIVFPFGPGLDSKSKCPFLAVHPDKASEQGVQVPLLIGYNSREGLISVNLDTPAEKLNRNYEKNLHPRAVGYIKEFCLTPEDLKRLYIKGGQITENNRENLVDLVGDVDFVFGIHKIVKIQVEKGSASTYLYRYCYDKTASPLKIVLGVKTYGACHADEMQHLFRAKRMEGLIVEPFEKGSAGYQLMEKMIELWVNFATTGRPTPGPTELIPFYWQPVNDGRILRYLNIDEDMRMEVTLNLEEHFLAQKITKNKL